MKLTLEQVENKMAQEWVDKALGSLLLHPLQPLSYRGYRPGGPPDLPGDLMGGMQAGVRAGVGRPGRKRLEVFSGYGQRMMPNGRGSAAP